MKRLAYCLFETPLGWCGIAWREAGDPQACPSVVLFQLPEATPAITAERIVQYGGAAARAESPPSEISNLMQRVCKHLNGDLQDFRDVAIDLDGTGSFAQQVYAAARSIPAGQTKTYGEIAKILNRPGAARAVGQALSRNPLTLIIPCHRVIAAGGLSGGFTAHGGLETKARMLAIEGVILELPSR